MITQETLDRINELARKAKTTGLTPEELAERDTLRRAYLDAVKASLTARIDIVQQSPWRGALITTTLYDKGALCPVLVYRLCQGVFP